VQSPLSNQRPFACAARMASTMQALNKSTVFGRTAELKARSPAPAAVRCPIVVRAEQVEVRDPLACL